MSVLNKLKRESVKFDASNKMHRQYFADFVHSKSWSMCPVKFNLEGNYVNVVAMIQDKLLSFYLGSDSSIVA